jgi:hypothetical protein
MAQSASEWWDRDMSVKIAQVVKFTVLKHTYDAMSQSNQAVLSSLYTIINETNSVVWQKALATDSLMEVKEEIVHMLINRYAKRGYPLPVLVYTDVCCEDRKFWKEIVNTFNELTNNAHRWGIASEESDQANVIDLSNLPLLKFPDNITPTLCSSPTSITSSIQSLKTLSVLNAVNGLNLIGLDVEWDAYGTGRPDTLQLSSPDGCTFVYQLGYLSPASIDSLRNLLQDPRYSYCGVAIKGDCTRLSKWFQVEVAETKDVISEAFSSMLMGQGYEGGKGLQSATANFLKKTLVKGNVRFSRWSSRILTEEQLNYSALDSYASVLCMKHVLLNSNYPPEDPPENGTLIYLYSESGNICLAKASVVRSAGGKFHARSLKTKNTKRIVVKLIDIYALHGVSMQNQTLQDIRDSEDDPGLTLWDMRYIRLREPLPSSTLKFDRPSQSITDYQTLSLNKDFFDQDIDVSARQITDEMDDDPEDGYTLEQVTSWIAEEFEVEDQSESSFVTICLDIFHAMQRITKTLSKSHGAFRAYIAALRDSFFLVSNKDMKAVEEALRAKGMSTASINLLKKTDYKSFLPYCRRLVPAKEILEARYLYTNAVFADIKDKKTGKALFSDDTQREVANLLAHIRKGCLSDPPDIGIYFTKASKDEDYSKSYLPLPRLGCLRGTPQLESS